MVHYSTHCRVTSRWADTCSLSQTIIKACKNDQLTASSQVCSFLQNKNFLCKTVESSWPNSTFPIKPLKDSKCVYNRNDCFYMYVIILLQIVSILAVSYIWGSQAVCKRVSQTIMHQWVPLSGSRKRTVIMLCNVFLLSCLLPLSPP